MSRKEIVEYMRSDLVKENFANALGGPRNAGPYITSVLLAVANNPKLQECTHKSIYTSALRAATLRLSCDQSSKQAYLVPYGKNATLIVGYKGWYDLAIRTGKYRYIHVDKIYQGEKIIIDRISGAVSIGGGKQGNTIAGWLASFQMLDGYSKSVYMTIEEIHEHKEKHSKGFNRSDSAWKTNPETMERKTVLRRLLTQWGYIDPSEAALLEIEDDSYDDKPIQETLAAETKELDQAQALRDSGVEVDETIIEGEIVEPPQPTPTTTQDPLWSDKESAGIYWDARDSNKKLYRDKPVSSLVRSLNLLVTQVAKHEAPTSEPELAKQTEANLKLEAVKYWIEQKTKKE